MPASEPLGAYLRARRAEVEPSRHQLPPGPRRRVAGLRREEVAELAGVSLEYYIRLEQGRHRHPSPEVLDALARALLLDEQGRAHLGRLTGQMLSSPETTQVDRARPGVAALVDLWSDQVCLLLSPYRDVLASNELARAVNPTFRVGGEPAAGGLRRPCGPYPLSGLGAGGPGGAAALRAAVGADRHNPARDRLVEELTAGSPDFARLWQRQDAREKPAGFQRFHVPSFGTLRLQYEPLAVPSSRQTLYVFFPRAGSDDAHLLARLASIAGVAQS